MVYPPIKSTATQESDFLFADSRVIRELDLDFNKGDTF